MKVIGTHDEIAYIQTKCTKYANCMVCILEPFCSSDMFVENNNTIDNLETILIPKGDGKVDET